MSGAHFAMVSDWMTNGNINEFVRANPDINRLELVSFSSEVLHHFELINDRIGNPAGRRC